MAKPPFFRSDHSRRIEESLRKEKARKRKIKANGHGRPNGHAERDSELGAHLGTEGKQRMLDRYPLHVEAGFAMVSDWEIGTLFLGEEIRFALLDSTGLPKPHQNFWGGLTAALLSAGLMKKTGDRGRMQDPRSHGRYTDQYRRENVIREDDT